MEKTKKQKSHAFSALRLYAVKDSSQLGVLRKEVLTKGRTRKRRASPPGDVFRTYTLTPRTAILEIEPGDTPSQYLLAIRQMVEKSTKISALVERRNLAERLDEKGFSFGPLIARVTANSPLVDLETPAYPDELLTRYKALTRKSWLGGLTAGQEEELVSLRDQIQAISRRDERSQEAARQVKRVNAALAALEEEVDARIAERTAELAGTERAGAAE